MTKKFFSHPIVKNALSLLTVQIAKYILPLVTIPYLARILGPQEWGLVIFAQVSSQWFEMILDYGFNLSATREIARNRDNQQQVTEIVASVMGASFLLLVTSTLVVLLMTTTVPTFKAHPDYLIWAWLIGIAQGLNPLWYFQAIERMQFPAMLDLVTRVIATVATFIWIKTPDEGWKVLAIQAIAGLIAYTLMLILMYRNIPWQLPRLGSALKALQIGRSMFLFRCSVSLFTTANTFILGLFVASSEVAFFGEAQQLSRAVGSLSSPISQAVFPRINYLLANDVRQAAKLASTNLIVMGLGSLSLAGVLAISAPLIVHTLLGSNFEPTIPLLRIQVILIPFICLNYVLGLQWMIPLGLDRAFNTIVMIVGFLNLILAPLAAQRFGSLGITITVVFSDALVTLGMYIFLWRKGLNPHQICHSGTSKQILEKKI
jgi:PST family polysaccharide transporter